MDLYKIQIDIYGWCAKHFYCVFTFSSSALFIYLKCVKQICVCGVHKFVFSLCSIFQARFSYLYYYYNFARILFFIISAEIITRIVVVGIYHQVASWWALMRCISYRYMCSQRLNKQRDLIYLYMHDIEINFPIIYLFQFICT